MTPAEALATATINPATVFKLKSQTGSLAKGKLAELALIDGDPSKNIGDLRQVELVMRDGKMMDAQALRGIAGHFGPAEEVNRPNRGGAVREIARYSFSSAANWGSKILRRVALNRSSVPASSASIMPL